MEILELFDPSTISGAILWGIFAGVITSILLSGLKKIYLQIIKPLYQRIVYKGVDLRGKWISQKTYPNGISYHYCLLIKQNAHDVKGSMTISKMNSQPGKPGGPLGDYVQQFNVNGTTWEGYVMLNLTSKDRRSLSFASSLVQVKNRGHDLIGHMAYRSSQNDQVDSEEIVWTRSL